MSKRDLVKTVLLLLVCMNSLLPVRAATLNITVADEEGNKISDAVTYAVAVGGQEENSISKNKSVIDQRDKEFIPYVSVFRTGTAVYFPNYDNIRHHVYSFSNPKQFEIPLYKGTPADPVVFDKPGVVVLGCNIHDWMSAYVFVSDTPFYAITNTNGKSDIGNLPAGEYRVYVWHPKLKGKADKTVQTVNLGNSDATLQFSIAQKRVWRPFRAPVGSLGGYR